MFDSPFEYCPRCGEYALLDQTQEQCAREYECKCACALRRFFSGMEIAETPKRPAIPIHRARP
jgi:hypothetical protein